MSDHNITRLVVGETYTVTLGVPVGQPVTQQDVSKLLRWENGRWKTAETIPEKIRRQAFSSNVLSFELSRTGTGRRQVVVEMKRWVRDRRVIWGAGLLAAFLVAYFGFSVGIRYIKEGDEFNFVPARSQSDAAKLDSAVKTVDAPFVRPVEDAPFRPLDEAPVDSRPVAAAVPTVAPSGVVTPVQSPSAPQGMPTAQPGNGPAANRPEQAKTPQQPAAMILDADGPAPKTAQQQEPSKAQQGVSVQQKPAQATAPAVAAGPAAQPAAKTASPAPANSPAAPQAPQDKKAPDAAQGARVGSGLVAVTPDGKIALFTNPKTRLPEKFSVGDKLPSGETIKSIDKNGKVITDAKEYRLE